jgi:hypothetical protein
MEIEGIGKDYGIGGIPVAWESQQPLRPEDDPGSCTHRFGDVCNDIGEHVIVRYAVSVSDGQGTHWSDTVTAWSAAMAGFMAMERHGVVFDPRASATAVRLDMVDLGGVGYAEINEQECKHGEGFHDLTIPPMVEQRLDYLRGEIEAQTISMSELSELESLAEYIGPEDTTLLEAAGVPEFADGDGVDLDSLTDGQVTAYNRRNDDPILTCDLCPKREWAGDLTDDWNGDTGNHRSCEAGRPHEHGPECRGWA